MKTAMDNLENVNYDFENDLQEELDDFILDENSDNKDDLGDEDSLFEEDMIDAEMEDEDPDTSMFQYTDDIKLRLTNEELNIIVNCEDPGLQKLLVYNRLQFRQLKEMQLKLIKTYKRCKYYFQREQEEASTSRLIDSRPSLAKTWIWKLGMPYFKDACFFGAPPNSDVHKKIENNEYVLLRPHETHRWTEKSQMILLDSIEKGYYTYYIEKLNKELQVLQPIIESDIKNVELEIEFNNKKNELQTLTNDPDRRKTPPLKCSDGINWLEIANNSLKGKHTIQECQAMWDIYLHPNINKTNWTAHENKRIRELVVKYKYQDWDSVAKELDTNRSGYLVCVHYYTKLHEMFTKERFQPEEDALLISTVKRTQLGDFIPWGKVASYFHNRSKHQLYNRYRFYLCRDDKIIKGSFSESEDILILHLIRKHGNDFKNLSELIPHRSVSQLRYRYNVYLKTLTNPIGQYMINEDRIILDHVKVNGLQSWSTLASTLKRTRSQVRQRYYTIKKALDKNPSITLKDLPRRNQDNIPRARAIRFKRLNLILKKLETYDGPVNLQFIDSLIKTSQQGKLNFTWQNARKLNSFSFFDQKLVEFFKPTCRAQRIAKTIDETLLPKAAQSVKQLFEILGGNTNLLKNCDVASFTKIFTNREIKILKVTKDILNSEEQSNENSQQIQNIIPPNLRTIIGLRSFLVRYELYKDAETRNALSCKSKPSLSNLENQLCKPERKLFFKRLYAIFKWSCIISQNFPKTLRDTVFLNITKAQGYSHNARPSITLGKSEKKRKSSNEEDTQKKIRYLPKRQRSPINKLKEDKNNIIEINEPSTSNNEIVVLSDLKLPRSNKLINKGVIIKKFQINRLDNVIELKSLDSITVVQEKKK